MSNQKPDRTAPVPLIVGIALILVGALVGNGALKGIVLLAGVLTLAYGVGQYMKQTRREKDVERRDGSDGV